MNYKTLLNYFAITFFVATNGVITGTVSDKLTGEKLAGVRLTTDKDTTYTDLDGKFTIKGGDEFPKISYELISYQKADTVIVNAFYTDLVKK